MARRDVIKGIKPGLPIGISIGDPVGIGPEVVLRSLPAVTRFAPVAVFGPARYLLSLSDRLGLYFPVRLVKDARELAVVYSRRNPPDVAVVDVPGPEDPVPGEPSDAFALASLTYVEEAAKAATAGAVSAIVTAPVNKAAINRAGRAFTGHTEYLAALTGVVDPVMLFTSGTMKIALATTHLPLSRVPDAINSDLIFKTIAAVDEHLNRWFGIEKPRIAVCGLNPHAGEGGYIGTEETEKIQPAIETAVKGGIKAGQKPDTAGPSSQA